MKSVICKECGKQFEYTLPSGRRIYCSKECAYTANKRIVKHIQLIQRNNVPPKAIRHCENTKCLKEYIPRYKNQRYCCRKCNTYKSHRDNDGFYQSQEWKQIRKGFFSIAINNHCLKCLNKGIINPAYALDHITPIKQGGSHSFNNLQGLCKAHHQSKSALEGNMIRLPIIESFPYIKTM